MDNDDLAILGQVPTNNGGGARMLSALPPALSALRANKGRSVLTALGIIIGVAAVIACLDPRRSSLVPSTGRRACRRCCRPI